MSPYSQLQNWDISRCRIYWNLLLRRWAKLILDVRGQPAAAKAWERLPALQMRGASLDPWRKAQQREPAISDWFCVNEGMALGTNLQIFLSTYVCQHSQIILATKGSTSLGISRRRFWKPTAPTTCIGFIPLHGDFSVASSQRITPKLYTSHLHTQQKKQITYLVQWSNK
jgi:hypothetical protein